MIDIDNETVRNGLMLLNWLTTCVVGALAWGARKQRASAKAFDDLNKKMDEKCARIAKLEGEQKAAPTRDEIIRIHERIDGKFRDIDDRLLEINEKIDHKMSRIDERICEEARATSLLLGQVSGQIGEISKQLTGRP